MRAMRSISLAAALLAAAASRAEQPIRGLEFAVAAGASGRTAIHLRARERSPVLLSGDPLEHGATLTVAVTGNGTDRQTFTLPALRRRKNTAGWRVRRGPV